MADESNGTSSTVLSTLSNTHSDKSQDKNQVKTGELASDEQAPGTVEEEAAGSDAISEGTRQDVVA